MVLHIKRVEKYKQYMYKINVILLFLYKNHTDTYNFTPYIQGATMTEINNINNIAGQIFNKTG